MKPTPYERQVIKNINEQTQGKPKRIFLNILTNVGNSLDKATAWLQKIPGAERIFNQVQAQSVKLFQEFSQQKASAAAVISEYAKAGFPQVRTPADARQLTLAQVECVADSLRQKYLALAEEKPQDKNSDEVSDIVALITLNRQAISDYATAYGFNINLAQERLFALHIMEYAATDDAITRKNILDRMLKMAQEVVSEGKQDAPVDKPSFLQTLRTMSSAVTIRLLKAKVGEVIPLTGAVIGGGFSAYFTHEVSDIARLLYRKRFLLEKYGKSAFEEALQQEEESDPDSSPKT